MFRDIRERYIFDAHSKLWAELPGAVLSERYDTFFCKFGLKKPIHLTLAVAQLRFGLT